MIYDYIKNIGSNEESLLHEQYIDLFGAVDALNNLVIGSTKGHPVKMSELRLTMVDLIATLEATLGKARNLRPADVPKGSQTLLKRMHSVVVQLANSTIYADKSERISLREFVQSYKDSFPFDKFKVALETHIISVRAAVDKRRTLASEEADPFLRKLVSSYSKHYSNLPTTLGGMPFKALKLPVVPLFKDITATIDPSAIERAGFKVTRVGDGFLVLEDQFLIAFDFAELGMRSGTRKVKGGFKVSQRNSVQRASDDADHQDKLLALIDKVNARSHVKYAIASGKFVPNPRNSKLWLAWIVTKAQRKGLEQALRTVEVDWGLPFNIDDNE